MFSELLALVALAGMAGTIGFAVALMLRRDAPTQTPPPAAERNLTESFYLEQRLQRLESGHNISININMPQVRYSAGAPERQQLARSAHAALPARRADAPEPAGQQGAGDRLVDG